MCGIAGVVSFSQRLSVSRQQLEAMSQRIAHRGPDDQGIYLDEAQGVGLVFRRLAILDLERRANQPMVSPDGRWRMVFNGEIYNYRSLRDQLDRELGGRAWQTSGDAEVLLMAWAQWGHLCLSKLNGMYAFVIWDQQEKTVFAARDRMGQKPLYFAAAGAARAGDGPIEAFAFASELPALMVLDWIDTTVQPSSLADYLLFGYIPSPRTIYIGVNKLQPGQWLKVTERGVVSQGYFDAGGYLDSGIPLEHDGLTAPQQTRRLLEQAVGRQMVSDVPIACFLSGGIDSSVVAACMRRHTHDVQSFSIGFDDRRYDETPFALRVARHLGLRHRTLHVTPTVTDDLARLAQVYGEPFADSSALPTHYLAREVGNYVKVALSGDGGDELFGGYERYRAMQLSQQLNQWPLIGALARSSWWQKLPGAHPKSRLARLKRFQKSLALRLEARYPSYMHLFEPQQLLGLFREEFVLRTDPQLIGDKWYKAYLDHRDPVQAALAIDRVTYLPEDVLTKVDRASMLHGLEVRSPLMDHEVVQFASNLTSDQLIGGGPKRMLREAFADDLPREVFRRRKMGFALPIGQWFRTSLRQLLHDALFARDSFASTHFNHNYIEQMMQQHQCGQADHSHRLYALLMLEMWWHGRGD